MILLIDNYDSFVYNLARYVSELGEEAVVWRNDAITLEEVAALAPSHIILSPGPATPMQAGISIDLVRRFGGTVPILGICLGHQSIGVAYGGALVRAPRPIHGKALPITHTGEGLFAGLPSPLRAARYHSLIIDRESLPACLSITATDDDGVIMAFEHSLHPVVGLQFHPESAASEYGYQMLHRFLRAGEEHDLPTGADGSTSAYREGEAPLSGPWRRDAMEPARLREPPPADAVR